MNYCNKYFHPEIPIIGAHDRTLLIARGKNPKYCFTEFFIAVVIEYPSKIIQSATYLSIYLGPIKPDGCLELSDLCIGNARFRFT